jgi:hypothetical protein
LPEMTPTGFEHTPETSRKSNEAPPQTDK